MVDTYKGESLGKVLARGLFWFRCLNYDPIRFFNHKILVLASREGGDVEVLKRLGVDPKNIVAVELDKRAAAAFREKHPDVVIRVGDVADIVRDKRLARKIWVAHLDFCSWFTPSVKVAAVTVARFGMMDDGILSVGVMKGRESPEFMNDLQRFSEELESERISPNEIRESSRYIAGVSGEPFGESQKRLLSEKAAQYSSAGRFKKISTDLRTELESSGPSVSSIDLFSVGYSSGMTPMLFAAQRVVRRPTTLQNHRRIAMLVAQTIIALDEARRGMMGGSTIGYTHRWSVPEAFVSYYLDGTYDQLGKVVPVLWTELGRVGRERIMTAIDAFDLVGDTSDFSWSSALFPISKRQLAAWKAHRTRGSYGSRVTIETAVLQLNSYRAEYAAMSRGVSNDVSDR